MTTHPLGGRRILVTGADGRIGTAVCRRLADLAAPVTGLSLPTEPSATESSATESSATGQDRHPAVDRMVRGDATDEAVVADALTDVELVVHLAAIPSPVGAPPYQVFRTNTDATFNVLTQAAERGIKRAVIASSINVLGLVYNSHPVRPAYFPLDEAAPADLDDAYSLSKVTDELTAGAVWRHWGMDVVALRFPYTTTESEIVAHSERQTADPSWAMLEGWSYLDVRDAALAVERSLVAEMSGAIPVFVAADNTLVPYPTADLLDRYAPDVPRKRSFTGREVPIDLTRARTVLGFRAEHLLDLPTLDLPR